MPSTQNVLLALVPFYVQALVLATTLYATPSYWQQPYRTSILLGKDGSMNLFTAIQRLYSE